MRKGYCQQKTGRNTEHLAHVPVKKLKADQSR